MVPEEFAQPQEPKKLFSRTSKNPFFKVLASQKPQNDSPEALRAVLGPDFAVRGSLRPPKSEISQDFAVRGRAQRPNSHLKI